MVYYTVHYRRSSGHFEKKKKHDFGKIIPQIIMTTHNFVINRIFDVMCPLEHPMSEI